MRSDRGASMSVLICVVVVALLVMAGLVIDGGAQTAAARRANAVAAEAARAGADASATQRIAGQDGRAAARRAAQAVLSAHPELTGSVSIDVSETLTVRTSASVPTVFLQLIGISRLDADGEATAQLRRG